MNQRPRARSGDQYRRAQQHISLAIAHRTTQYASCRAVSAVATEVLTLCVAWLAAVRLTTVHWQPIAD